MNYRIYRSVKIWLYLVAVGIYYLITFVHRNFSIFRYFLTTSICLYTSYKEFCFNSKIKLKFYHVCTEWDDDCIWKSRTYIIINSINLAEVRTLYER